MLSHPVCVTTYIAGPPCADGRLYLAFLFYGTYFANASAWSELSVTVRSCPYDLPSSCTWVVKVSHPCLKRLVKEN